MTVAVLDTYRDDGQVAYIAGRPAPARFARRVGDLADLQELGALLHRLDGVTQLWLTPRFSSSRAIVGLEKAWTPCRFAGNATSAIVAPALNRRLAAQLGDVRGGALLDAIQLVNASLGVTYEGSPGMTAEMLLRGILARRREFEPPSVPDELPRVLEPVLSWIRPLAADELEKPWVIAVDRRAAYLHAMTLCDVGLGEPQHVDRPAWRELVWTPGYYHARLHPWPELILPDPLRSGREGDVFWLTAPALRLAEQLGMVADVDEAWTWPKRSRALASLGRRIFKARERVAREAPELVPIADPLLKRSYTELVGRFRMEAHKGTPLYRPDWHAHIVADARVRIWRGAYFAADTPPAACNLDCWYILADAPILPPAYASSPWWRLIAAAPAADVGLDVFDGRSVGELAKRVRAAAVRA